MQIDKLAITACKQYCLAAGATQGNIANTQNVITNYFWGSLVKIAKSVKEVKIKILIL